jgi:GPI transamidase subunit PIG-U
LVGSSQYTAVLHSSFGDVLLWKHAHPNLSVLWYLNMEVFERYRVYFAVLIGGLPYLLLVPVTIRLHRYPMVLVSCHEFCCCFGYLLVAEMLIHLFASSVLS